MEMDNRGPIFSSLRNEPFISLVVMRNEITDFSDTLPSIAAVTRVKENPI